MEKTREVLEIENYDPPARFEDSIAAHVPAAMWARMRKAQRAWEIQQQAEQDINESIRNIAARVMKAKKAQAAAKRSRKKAS